MSIPIVFYQFSKKPNSTKRPAIGTKYNCNLLDDCSIINPKIVILENSADFNPRMWNYAYIKEFDRYYYVNDWVYSKRTWIASCNVDPLASWKNGIGVSSQYITRCGDNEEGDYIDNKYPTFSYTEQVNVSPESEVFSKTYGGGTFVVGIWSGTSAAQIGPTFYAMHGTTLHEFLTGLFVPTIFDELVTSGWNPLKYITSIRWYPLGLDSFAGIRTFEISVATKTIEVEVAAHVINNFSVQKSLKFNIPKHPQAQMRGNHLTAEPYTSRSFVWHPVGAIPLDCGIIYAGSVLDVAMRIDVISGVCNMEFICNGKFITTANFNMGCEIPVDSTTFSISGFASDFVTAISGAIKGDFAGAISGAINIPSNMLNNFRVQGSGGGIAMYIDTAPIICTNFKRVGIRNREIFGAPYCHYDTISNHSGFIMCENPVIEIAATAQESAEILKHLEGGFYFE